MPILRSDIGLSAGDYYMTISPPKTGRVPLYLMRTTPLDARSPLVEEEPNDSIERSPTPA